MDPGQGQNPGAAGSAQNEGKCRKRASFGETRIDALEGLATLARKAREDPTPVFGVAEAVRLRLQSESPETVTLIPLGLFGGISALAASVTLALAVQFL